MRINTLILYLLILISSERIYSQSVDLSGTWEFSLDSIDWSDTVELPGSMLENGKGDDVSLTTRWVASIYDSSYYFNPRWEKYREPGNIKLPFFLTPKKHYIGKAWYRRIVDIEHVSHNAILSLERVHIESNLYVNGRHVGTCNSLSVPHRYKVGEYLSKGTNEIVICIDNDPDIVGVGIDSHSISDQTQGCWNGAVGRLAIDMNPKIPPYETDSTFRKFEIRGKMFYVDGKKTFLRGTVDNCNFPLTGYPPMDEESWMKIFEKCKLFGLNHMRFHSYCPPEAAFVAADKLGFYLQVEGPSWPNHGVKLGVGEKVDKYLWDELERIISEYGHHPSFCMLAAGNEPRGRWVKWVEKFTDYWSNRDKRRVYTGASVGWRWDWMPKNQYHVKAGARGLEPWITEMPSTMDDFSSRIDTIKVPFVCHELGQWCVFPDLSDTIKFTGVYKAENMKIFRDELERNGMLDMAEKFNYASGKLQLLCYKYEIEKILRTPDYAGYQMLGLNDYSGQGTAPVGLTDVFYGDKKYCSPDDFTAFSSNVVPLLRIPRFVYSGNETLHGEVEVTQFMSDTLKSTIKCVLYSENDNDIVSTIIKDNALLTAGNNRIDKFDILLPNVDRPVKYTLTISSYNDIEVLGQNSWNIWVYPKTTDCKQGNVYITDRLDFHAIKKLKNGGNVLLLANKRMTYGLGIEQQFLPVFWNTSWFKMRPPHTTGLYINDSHSVFNNFATDNHSDLQWWELVNNAPVMLMSDFPRGMQPIVQPIDTWFISRKLGMLFEANVLNGKIIVTSFDLESDMGNRIVAKNLKESILNYMNSDNFKPEYSIDIETINGLFTKQTPKIGIYTKDSPDELKATLQ